MILEALATAGVALAVGVGVLVGLVALLVGSVGVMVAANVVLNELTRPRNAWRPPENQMEEAYKLYIQRIRDTAAYTGSLFVKGKEDD